MRNKTLNCLLVVAALAIVGASSMPAEAQPPIPQTNLLTWLAADNINGDQTNPAGGTAVPAWADLSGNENHFVTMLHDGGLVTSTPPTYSTSGGPSGLPSVEFDGIDNGNGLMHAFWTSSDPFISQPWSSPQFFMVMKATPGADQSHIISTNGATYFNWQLDDTTGGVKGSARESINSPGAYRFLSRPGFEDMTPTPSVADYKVLSLYTDIYTGVDHPGYPQWLVSHTLSPGQDVTVLGTPDYAYGTNAVNFPADVAIPYEPSSPHYTYSLNLGANSDGWAWSEMSISELIVYDSPTGYPMPAADRLQVENYLYDKYFGLAVQNADFDSDLDVDGADFLTWQRGLGTGTTLAEGDANEDNVVDGADLAIWESQYGIPVLSAASSAVPEPSALLLTVLACGCLILAKHRAAGSE